MNDKPCTVASQHSDLDRGWSWVVLIAAFMALFVVGGTNYSAGLIHTTLLDRYHEKQSTTSWAGALHTALFNLAAPLSGILADKTSVRTAILCGGLLMAIGYFCSAFATSLNVTIVTCGIISGLGGALTWTSAMVSTGFYFRKYRNLALGFSLSGTALGIFGIAPAIQTGKENHGTTGFFITLSCIALQLVVCAVIMKPSSLEIESQREKREAVCDKNRRSALKNSMIYYLKVLTCGPIMCMSISMFMYCAGTYTVFQYLPNYCLQEGTLPIQASFVLSACGVASIFGRLATGFAASWRNVNEVILYAINVTLTGVAIIVFPLYAQTYFGQIVFSSLFGLFFGGPYVTITPTNIKFVGVPNMAIALGIELCFGGIGSIIGPVLAGFILDKGATFGQVFVIAGVCTLLSAGLGLFTLVFEKCEPCFVRGFSEKTMEMEVKEETEQNPMLDKEYADITR